MQTDHRSTGYRNTILTKWLPIYVVLGGIIYVVVYFVFINGGGGGGTGGGGY